MEDEDWLERLGCSGSVGSLLQLTLSFSMEGAILLEGLRLSGMEFSLDRALLLFLFCCIAGVESRWKQYSIIETNNCFPVSEIDK